MSRSRDRRIRHVVEAVIAAFLFAFHFAFQYVPWGIWGMFVPLVPYIVSLLTYPTPRNLDRLRWLLFSEELTFGRIVAVAGFIIFLIACIQFLRSRGKLITAGLYSVVRHPQYFGITIMTLGITIMLMQCFGPVHRYLEWLIFGPLYMDALLFARLPTTWLIQVLGYVLLACYEERHLLKEYKGEYGKYRQKIPLIFPIPCPTKISEPLFSMGLALSIIFFCTFIIATF